MIERKFVKRGIRNTELEAYLRKELENADFSHSEIRRTPLNTRIILFAARPGMVIGRGGQKIQELTEKLKKDFAIDNPQIEVVSVENPMLDAKIVAKQIANALQRGLAYRRVVNVMLKDVMDAGALGIEIRIGGKLGGARSRSERFQIGYLKKSGHSALENTERGDAFAILKAGCIGIQVRIMKSVPDILMVKERVHKIGQKPAEEPKTEEVAAEEPKAENVELEVVDPTGEKTEEKKAPKKKATKKAEGAEETKAEKPAKKTKAKKAEGTEEKKE